MRPATRLRARDAVAVSTGGLRARRLRAALPALGIAIAIAALVAVLGIAESSKAELLDQLGEQGNLLTVAAGTTFGGDPAPLPATAPAMIRRIPPVRSVSAVGDVSGVTVRRSAAVPPQQTGGITVLAAQPSLVDVLAVPLARGAFLPRPTFPETVLGDATARILGIGALDAQTQVYLGGTYFTVVGVLAPAPVAPRSTPRR
ncbi:ABC transporter permease [Dactylosporangium cerinum]